MRCTICGADTLVIDSRLSQEGKTIRRRRQCRGRCSYRFTTFEYPASEIPTLRARNALHSTLLAMQKLHDQLTESLSNMKGVEDPDATSALDRYLRGKR